MNSKNEIQIDDRRLQEMSRKEMQSLLVKLRQPANGTNLVLRKRIHDYLSSRLSSTPLVCTSSASISGNLKREDAKTQSKDVRLGVSSSTSAVKKKSQKKSPKMNTDKVIEKRLRRTRSRCPASIMSRIERAKTQKLYLINQDGVIEKDDVHGGPSCIFHVLGSTGNVYDVKICKIPHCNCPDHAKGNLCKHILFIFLKVVGLKRSSSYVYQSALLQSELEEIFSRMHRRLSLMSSNKIMANEAVRKAYKDGLDGTDYEETSKRKELTGDDDCAICFDAMDPKKEELTFCKSTCGTNFHKKCIQMWILSENKTKRDTINCPICRQPWLDDKVNQRNNEGYKNMAKLQGQSRVRDSSTYSSWLHHRWKFD